ncbi:MAG: hypothetical protein GY703_23470 [Gammaproteobacteria bacterium]|nr:hypothetical protein [Gammaproteobacteria bacterium]
MTKIFIHDEFEPEASAMLQALYSRSAESVETHVRKVKERGSSRFMESYYVGYGHSSIGDCGTTTIFIEGLSILATKAVQDNPLYSGQETSTRYIDFSKQPMQNPLGLAESRAILDRWIDYYTSAGPTLVAHLKSVHPLQQAQKPSVWEKAIDARAFDILRGFLPAGITTQLSWSTNLRQAHDKLLLLRHHPLEEVREIAVSVSDMLKEKYPSSFGHSIRQDQEDYLETMGLVMNYSDLAPDGKGPEFAYDTDIDNTVLESDALALIAERPSRTNLPRHLSQYGRYRCRFNLDYGSFRDLQRHRNGLCPVPLLNHRSGFHRWYLEQLPEALRTHAISLIAEQLDSIDSMGKRVELSPVDRQYFLPLGMKVPCEIVYDLPEMVYVTELRSGSTVHPTLRTVAHGMHAALTREHPRLKLYSDLSVDPWDIRRGEQDIVERDPGSS